MTSKLAILHLSDLYTSTIKLAAGTSQWGATPSILASNKLRPTGTVLILWRSPLPSVPRSQFGDCRFSYPQPMMFSGQHELAYYVVHPASNNDGQRAAQIISLYFGDKLTVISPSKSDARQPARSPLFSVSVNDDDQQAERSSRVLCQWTYGWITVTGAVKPLFHEITKDVYRTEAKIVDMVPSLFW
ncbi:hypothetical protein NC651_006027 [Populus alba x Populus x berolinensis]|nr:hypothetical protein NC651_006027 [Populus alba x Populus x berolinensis]